MGAFQTLVTIVGLIGIVALLFLLFCRYLGGWTWSRTWLTSSREEKMVLTRAGVAGQYNPNGYMIPSDSDLNLSGGGSFRRFDKTDHDYQLLRQGSASSLTMIRIPNIPPQPLRPAPLPPPSQVSNQIQNQSSVDSVFTAPSSPCPPPKIPPPPNQQSSTSRHSGGLPSLSSTNPFLPLIQASTQFFSQTLQSFQSFQPSPPPQQHNPGPPAGYFQNPESRPSNDGFYPFGSENVMSSTSTDSSSAATGKLSMGEILFSTSSPMNSPLPGISGQPFSPAVVPSNYKPDDSYYKMEPLSHLPVHERSSVGMQPMTPPTSNSPFTGINIDPEPTAVAEETDTLINMEPYGDEIPSEQEQRNTLLETMRAEIRLENERMEDATKSLLMEELDFLRRDCLSSTVVESASLPAPPAPATTVPPCQVPPNPLPPLRPTPGTKESVNSGRTASDSVVTVNLDKPAGVDRKFSAPEIGVHGLPSGGSQVTSNGTLVSASPIPSHRTRSFSLRQASIDSIGDMSDLASPDSLPNLQRAMSCDSVCSDTSVVLGELDAPHITGQLCVGLEYDSETADLIVNVIEGKELVGLDPDPSAPFDSYVRVYLLPDKTTNMQTRVYRKSLSPVYKEKFMFGLEVTELPTRSLVFYLYATNKFSNTLIGEAELKLTDADIKQPRIIWLPLTDTGQRGGELGEIIFSLSYLPTAERLTVVVVKARNLRFPHQRDTGDPFVKVYLLQRGKKVSKKKSSTKRGERNPIFNEAMIFSVPTHSLQTIQLRISVSDSSETEGRAYSIGHVIIGSMATGKPLSHWNQMLSSLRKPIAMWHSLRK